MKKYLLTRGLLLLSLCLLNPWANAQTTETEIQKVLDANGNSAAYLGYSVAISGNLAIVGAYGDYANNGFVDAGAAIIYELDASGVWVEKQKLIASDAAPNDQFGRSVAISGNRVIIGAWGDDDNGATSGAAYIFELAGGTWQQVSKLLPSDGAANDFFGWSVSISGDRALVGAYGQNIKGSAYIFEQSGGTWNETAKIIAADNSNSVDFGYSVSISGDRAIVGSSFGFGDRGSAHIFEQDNNGIWSEKIQLFGSNAYDDARFGNSVAISGDRAIVGALLDGLDYIGSAYIYERDNNGIWAEKIKLLASDGSPGDFFGTSVSIDGDQAVVGAWSDGVNGSAYLFKRTTDGTWAESSILIPSDGSPNTPLQFGQSVSLSGENAIVGAWGGRGSAYFFEISEAPECDEVIFPLEINGEKIADVHLSTEVVTETPEKVVDIIYTITFLPGYELDYPSQDLIPALGQSLRTSLIPHYFGVATTSYEYLDPEDPNKLIGLGLRLEGFDADNDFAEAGAYLAIDHCSGSISSPITGQAIAQDLALGACSCYLNALATYADPFAGWGDILGDIYNPDTEAPTAICLGEAVDVEVDVASIPGASNNPLWLHPGVIPAQSFQPVSTGLMSRIDVKIANTADVGTITLDLYSGTDPNNPGTLLGSASFANVNVTDEFIPFIFNSPIAVTAGNSYLMILNTTGFHTVQTATVIGGDPYQGGTYYYNHVVNTNSFVSYSIGDMVFKSYVLKAGAGSRLLALDANGNANLSPSEVDGGSSDNSGNISLSLSPNSFSCQNLGDMTPVTLTVTDDAGNQSSCSINVSVIDPLGICNQPPVAVAKPLVVSADANCQAVVTAADFDDGSFDPDGDPLTYAISPAGPFGLGEHPITFTVTDSNGNSDEVTTTLTVENAAPVINSISATAEPVAVNTSVSASVDFTDTNLTAASFDWGDGTSGAGTIAGNTASASHTYSGAGVYVVTATLTDACGASVSQAYEYVVVYDPSGGFVTGGGWIHSPEGAYAADPSLSGKASFGFVSKYKKGATVPTGNTEFQFKAGDLSFKSSSYEWLVVAGTRAKFKGDGLVNDMGGYGFMLTATDDENGDRFRIKIWDSNDQVVYDNEMGADDQSDAMTTIGGGSIVVHDGKGKINSLAANSVSEFGQEPAFSYRAYPNPVMEQLYLNISSETAEELNIKIFDMTGRLVHQRLHQVQVGENQVEMNTADWNVHQGKLILQLESPSEGVQHLRLLKL